ncbi:MAG: TIGR02300 family protein [Rhodobacteraceae bacterium]|nr:TIGR02300 family protein [Paracoccaceae bacterium]
MAKEEWGTKRVCPTTGKRFYDLNRTPIISPYTGEVVTLDTGRSRTMITERAKPGTSTDDEPVVLEDDDDDSSDVDLGDEILEDDEEDENVSLDDIADVASDDD